MRILFSLLFFALLGGTALSAQNFGVRAGLNLTNITVNDGDDSDSFDSQTNLMLGLFVDLPLGGGKFMLSPELSYLGRGYDFSFNFLSTPIETKVNLAYLDLGVLAKYMLVDNGTIGVYIGAGPVVGYAMSGTVESNGDKEDIEFEDDDGFNRTNLSLAGTVGLTFAQLFFVEGRYMAGLSSLNDDTDDSTAKWNSFGLNGGVRVPLGN